MKAAIYTQPGDPSVFEVRDIPNPEVGANDVLIIVEAISIEGGDLLSRSRKPPSSTNFVVGYAAAGKVKQVGDAVSRFRPGQRVTTFSFSGSHAELRSVPEAFCWHVPDNLDLSRAASIPCGPGTSEYALELGGVTKGTRVLILGASGSVGNAAVQLAAQEGAYVIGTGRHANKLEDLKKYGLSEWIDTSSRTASSQIKELLHGSGADVVIDNIGGNATTDGLNSLRDGGTEVLVGAFGGASSIETGHLLFHRLNVVGCLLGAVMDHPDRYNAISKLLEKASNGQLDVPIDSTFSLSHVADAHRRAESSGRFGKVIITP